MTADQFVIVIIEQTIDSLKKLNNTDITCSSRYSRHANRTESDVILSNKSSKDSAPKWRTRLRRAIVLVALSEIVSYVSYRIELI